MLIGCKTRLVLAILIAAPDQGPTLAHREPEVSVDARTLPRTPHAVAFPPIGS